MPAARPAPAGLRQDSLLLTPGCSAPGYLRPERASQSGCSVAESGRVVGTHHFGPPLFLVTEGTSRNLTVAGVGVKLIEQYPILENLVKSTSL